MNAGPGSDSGAADVAVPASAGREGAGWSHSGLAFGLAAIVTSLDLWSKSAVFSSLPPDERHWVAGQWFGFTPVLNPGIMWGAFAFLSPYLPWLRVVAALVVVLMLRGTPARAWRLQAALGLVLGGALGNIYDGFTVGKVRDFVLVDLGFQPFHPFPVFNIADSAICVGVGLLALGMLLDRPAPET